MVSANKRWRTRRGRKSPTKSASSSEGVSRAKSTSSDSTPTKHKHSRRREASRKVSFGPTPAQASQEKYPMHAIASSRPTATGYPSHVAQGEDRKQELVRRNSAMRYLQRHGSVEALEAATIGFSDMSSSGSDSGSEEQSALSRGSSAEQATLRRQLSNYGQAMFAESLSQESVGSSSTVVSSGTDSIGTAGSTSTSSVANGDAASKREGFKRTRSELQKMIEQRLASRSKSPEAKPVADKEEQFHTPWELPSRQKVLFNYTARNIPKLNEMNLSKPETNRRGAAAERSFPARNYDAVFPEPKPSRLAAKKFSKGPEMFAQLTLSDVIW